MSTVACNRFYVCICRRLVVHDWRFAWCIDRLFGPNHKADGEDDGRNGDKHHSAAISSSAVSHAPLSAVTFTIVAGKWKRNWFKDHHHHNNDNFRRFESSFSVAHINVDVRAYAQRCYTSTRVEKDRQMGTGDGGHQMTIAAGNMLVIARGIYNRSHIMTISITLSMDVVWRSVASPENATLPLPVFPLTRRFSRSWWTVFFVVFNVRVFFFFFVFFLFLIMMMMSRNGGYRSLRVMSI